MAVEGGEQAGELEAERDGDGVLEVGTGGHGGGLVGAGEEGECGDEFVQFEGEEVEGVAELEDGGRVGHVLGCGAPVRPFAGFGRGAAGGGGAVVAVGEGRVMA